MVDLLPLSSFHLDLPSYRLSLPVSVVFLSSMSPSSIQDLEGRWFGVVEGIGVRLGVLLGMVGLFLPSSCKWMAASAVDEW